ncbi:Toll/interleukin-1 receptor domain-containing protein [Tanacetum coccineum]
MEIFDACGFHPEIGIKVLIQKSLITIDSKGRVWKHAEVSNLCYRDATVENDQIEVIDFDYSSDHDLPHVIMLISKMKKLSLFPDSFQATNLVFLQMLYSKQKLLWKGYKHIPQLKVLRLQFLKRLVSTPDFNGLPNLQELELMLCGELEEIHPSLGNHRSLKYVHVFNCYKLRMFPTIVRMEQLESLHIRDCHKSLVFPEIQANMECLVELNVYDIRIDALLSSIGERCTNLIYLSLIRCFTLNSIQVKFDGLKCLEEFKCSKGREKIPFPLPLTLYFKDGEVSYQTYKN